MLFGYPVAEAFLGPAGVAQLAVVDVLNHLAGETVVGVCVGGGVPSGLANDACMPVLLAPALAIAWRPLPLTP